VVAGAKLDDFDRSMLGTFANQAAIAIERRQLQAQALRTELLEEADRWRSALLGAVSHDLRTPLSAIKASIGTLREPTAVLSAQDHEVLLETVELECDLLTGLVANLLDMARLETGTLQLRNEPQGVADVVAQGVQAARSATADHVLVVELDDELPLVDVDLVLIGQVLANLLTNAAQHSPDGSTITVAARREATHVVVSVSDEGPGVPERTGTASSTCSTATPVAAARGSGSLSRRRSWRRTAHGSRSPTPLVGGRASGSASRSRIVAP
jgi:two-component system sensor histidine kinase KdpD